MEYTEEQIVEALGSMSVIQMIALTKQLEEKWGIKAAPPVVSIQSLPKEESTVKQQTEFNLILVSFPPDKKMGLIKLVREIMAISLVESKTLVESVPKLIKESVSKEDAELFKGKLEEAGG